MNKQLITIKENLKLIRYTKKKKKRIVKILKIEDIRAYIVRFLIF